jgi:nucleotide-binding universal stress UspA family protein
MDVPEIGFKKILYTTALSERGRYAFAYAASLAHQYTAELTVIHVIEEEPDLDKHLAGYMGEKLWEEIKQRNLAEARQLLIDRKRDNTAIKECVQEYCEIIQKANTDHPYVTYDIVISMGNPVEQILLQVEKGGYDLIVMSNLGHSTLKDAVLGSTVQRVLRRAKIPVLVVRLPQK